MTSYDRDEYRHARHGIVFLWDRRKYVAPAGIENEIVTERSRVFILFEDGEFVFIGDTEAYVNGERTETNQDVILSIIDCSESA